MAVLALTSWAATGCGDGGDGPTAPDPAPLFEIFGSTLYRADGSSVSVGTLESNPIIGVYFASPGCPACGGFTPLLVEVYEELKENGRAFEVVLASPGLSEDVLYEYMEDSQMGWLAVPPGGNTASKLVNRYNIQWVPTLVILDEAGNTLSYFGRDEVVDRGTGAYDLWMAIREGG